MTDLDSTDEAAQRDTLVMAGACADDDAPQARGANHDAERREEQAQLRRLSAAVQQASESILITDLDGRIEYVNRAACERSGYAEAELIGRSARIFQSGHTPPQVNRELWDEITAGRTWRGFIFNRRKDGTDYAEFGTVTPIRDIDGAVTNYLAVHEDVTEKQRMSEELETYRDHLEDLVVLRTDEIERTRRAAEAASAAKSAFLAAMSHEIRTPMNGVLGLVDVLLQSSLSPYQRELANTIGESAGALLRVIDDILDFSKIEADKLVLASEPFDLARLIEHTADALLPIATAQGIELRVFIEPALVVQRLGDPARVRQIINNLVGNAIKFSARLERPGRVELRVTAHGDGVRITVVDNGIGMALDTLARLFQPFVQAEPGAARPMGGTGLGLVISRRLVQAMGGDIAVDSALGAGSTFRVDIPLPALDTQRWPAERALAGVTCHLWVDDAQRTQDWHDYLVAAGAKVKRRQLPDPSSTLRAHARGGWPLRQAQDRPGGPLDAAARPRDDRPHVLIHTPAPTPASWAGSRAAATHAWPTVCVQHGQRRSPRLMAPDFVSLDLDGMRRDDLLHAVCMALGRSASPPARPAAAADAARPDLEVVALRGRRVLVAEDNDVNHKVVAHQLRLLGIVADIAADGQEALDRWKATPGRYDLLLTDLRMPRLDGYGLARAIRRHEDEMAAATARDTASNAAIVDMTGRLPIVALTANAMLGEADRCRASGMDDYLTKPAALQALQATLLRWLGSSGPAARAAGMHDDTAPAPLDFDDSMLARQLGEDPAPIEDLRQEFLRGAEAAMAEVEAAATRHAWASVADIAHRLKSSSLAVGALALGRSLGELEQAAAAHAASACGAPHDDRAQAALPELTRSAQRAWLAAKDHLVPALAHERRRAAVAAPRIVVVDDEPFQHRLIERMLRALAAPPVECFDSGLAALRRLQSLDSTSVLLVIDLNMPGMDGVELIRHLAQSNFRGTLALASGADTRVLETATRLAQAWRLRTVGHLRKPLSSDELRDALQRWRGSTASDPQRPRRSFTPEEVRRAIEQGQVCLHYQPQIDLADGRLLGVEALARWQHPELGLLGPDAFIPVAEANGLIDTLTDSVVQQALAQSARWIAELGQPVRVAVNVSMDNLSRLDFPDRVFAGLEDHGVPASSLTLEVTESRLMKDMRAALDTLARLRLRGISLSIDDFGTGHSSLAQLRDLPFVELKVDRGFVHGGRSHATLRAILSASVEMARQLGMHVVAEGVEDEADWEFVKEAGCSGAQGWFIARPMRGDALVEWVRERGGAIATTR